MPDVMIASIPQSESLDALEHDSPNASPSHISLLPGDRGATITALPEWTDHFLSRFAQLRKCLQG